MNLVTVVQARNLNIVMGLYNKAIKTIKAKIIIGISSNSFFFKNLIFIFSKNEVFIDKSS